MPIIFEASAAPPGPLATVSDLSIYQAGDEQAAIDQATALVRAYCRWHVSPSLIETITVDSSDGPALMLPTLHITDVSAVTQAGVVLDPTYYTVHAGYLLRADDSGCWSGPVTVSLTHGFPDVPLEVRAIILAVASRAQVSPDGVIRRQVGAVSESYSQTGFNVAGGVSLMQHEKDTLDLYKLPPRP